jgi:hypothetical protein
MSDSISFLPYNHSLAARDYLHRLLTIILSLSSCYGQLTSTIHDMASRHFPQSTNDRSPSSQTPSHYSHDGINMVGQSDLLGLSQISIAYSMPVQNSIIAPAGQMPDGSQFPAMLNEVTSAEYMPFGAHHASAGAGQQATQNYTSYRYMQ